MAEQTQKKPNILVIMADDVGVWNISYNSRGQLGYRTPNIDRVTHEGVAFAPETGLVQPRCGAAANRGSERRRPPLDLPHFINGSNGCCSACPGRAWARGTRGGKINRSKRSGQRNFNNLCVRCCLL
jgi:hypothetical protein